MITSSLSLRAQAALERMEARLLAEFNPERPWRGQLSSSAISTAIAIFTLRKAGQETDRQAIEAGQDWLRRTRNPDGGWGDSPESPTNLTATLLTWFASSGDPVMGATWLQKHIGGLSAEAITKAIRQRYGHDLTFSVPILTMGTLAGCLGPEPQAWKRITQLPLELAALPRAWFRFLNMGVVSYALPALISMGLVHHRRAPSRTVPVRWLRDRLTSRLLAMAEGMQPPNGGYEEATPLTGFVSMSLIAAGFSDHRIVHRALAFLRHSQRPDGSWPIDSDLATWVTANAVNILLEPGSPPGIPPAEKRIILRWLLQQQQVRRHPLTGGAPGGWGWTDLPGAMPDADDTAAVLLAIRRLDDRKTGQEQAARQAIEWLLSLQNHDGGIPTFSRGWGKLPFDRSCPDLTAHALEALSEWKPAMDPAFAKRIHRGMARMLRYLSKSQTREGAWLPLWFGSQAHPDESNPVYGTARTLLALTRLNLPATDPCIPLLQPLIQKSRSFLIRASHADGGWGAQPGAIPAIEETAMALAALTRSGSLLDVEHNLKQLLDLTHDGKYLPAAPIGLYFARLWYSEQLYPLLFSISALRGFVHTKAGGRRPHPLPTRESQSSPQS